MMSVQLCTDCNVSWARSSTMIASADTPASISSRPITSASIGPSPRAPPVGR
jgi:hypothetical protein